MNGIDTRRAQRWFWALTVIAILAMGGLYRELGAESGPGTAVLTLFSGVVLLLTGVQAARILTRLAGPPRLPWRHRATITPPRYGSRVRRHKGVER